MRSLLMTALMTATLATPVFAEGESHFVAIHVDQNDPQVMNMALNNAQNVANYYESQGDEVTIELVAYGLGMQMFVAETSPVADRIAAMSLSLENLSFSACGNTHAAMQKRAGIDVPLLEEVNMTPSGVVRLIELQEQGFAYVRP
ncbi:MAG: intracellular sulfur oxidation DsrE/DsrF family protein [Reinekea sp.]|jgi:intracellular sulfur oxidation DsrE/DsrF family protein